MSDTTPIKKRRVFWTKCVLKVTNDDRRQYNRTKHQTDFPAETSEQDAVEAIYAEHGRITNGTVSKNNMLIAPTSYAEVQSTIVVELQERATLDTFKSWEVPLFSAEEMFKAQGRKK